MATGMLPSWGKLGVIFEAILNRAPLPPVRLNPDLPAELETDRHEVFGERSEPALPTRFRRSHRYATAEAGHG